MPVIRCPACSRTLRVPDHLIGKTVRCPGCRTKTRPTQPPPSDINTAPTNTVPNPGSSPATAAPSAWPTVNALQKTPGGADHARFRRRGKSHLWSAVLAAGLLFVAVAVGAVLLAGNGSGESFAFVELQDQSVVELALLEFTASVAGVTAADVVEYSLVEGPLGATLEPTTGVFRWTPAEEQGPGHYWVTIQAACRSTGATTKSPRIGIAVQEQNQLPQVAEVGPITVAAGEVLEVPIVATDPDVPPRTLRYRLGPGAPSAARIDARSGVLTWRPASSEAGRDQKFVVHVDEAVPAGGSAKLAFSVAVRGPSPELDGLVDTAPTETNTAPTEAEPPGTASDTRRDAGVAATPFTAPPAAAADLPPVSLLRPADVAELRALYEEKKLFAPKHYADLRAIFARRFAREHATEMKTAFGDAHDALEGWLAEHAELRDEFYLALDPEADDLVRALTIFRQIQQQHPDYCLKFGNLAIAIAVTWDDEQAVYDYGRHQRRAKAKMPDGLLGPTDSFAYFIEAEQFMQGRAQWLPWEFLVHVVNHKTPAAERRWAVRNYLAGRAMIGKCYSQVPYDNLMLETNSSQGRLNGAEYTLANLRQLGGVCAHQADFASRVGQSLGVPAAYVRGPSSFGEDHAWVMWVDVKAVSQDSIAFSLESHGRYRGDKYYVGTLTDPHTGQQITDRQLELRLNTVGLNVTDKRHAELAMRAYTTLVQEVPFTLADKLSYLENTVTLCPGNEQAWRALARLVPEVLADKAHKKRVLRLIDRFFATFGNFPDYTWEVFHELAQIEQTLAKRIELYNRLALMYVAGQRPDLACEARLRLTELLLEADRDMEAIQGLSQTMLAFPDEGRYVPRMLDRMESLCQQVDGSTPALLSFYNALLPRIPQTRGDRPSPYCVSMYRRAITLFQQHDQPQAAAAYQAELGKLGG